MKLIKAKIKKKNPKASYLEAVGNPVAGKILKNGKMVKKIPVKNG